MNRRTDALVYAISNQVDDHNRARGVSPGHLLRIRTGKIAEEVGEVEEALIAVEGSNPRKPERRAAILEVETELLDVMLAAAGAWAHLYPNGSITEAFAEHVAKRADRVGIVLETWAEDDDPERPHYLDVADTKPETTITDLVR